MHLYFSLLLAGYQNWDTFVWWWGDHTPGTQLRCIDHLPSPGIGIGEAGWIPAQGTKGKEPIACAVSGITTVLQRRTMMLI